MTLATHLRKGALNALYFSRAYKAFARSFGGVGVIFTLHHVRPNDGDPDFHPNRILEVTPAFLKTTIEILREEEIEIVSLDEAALRLAKKRFDRRFACLTLDDGYADNLNHALPVFEALEAPFAIYVSSGLPDGLGELWWDALETVIAQNTSVSCEIGGREIALPTETPSQKMSAYETLYWMLRDAPEEEQRTAASALAVRHGVEMAALCRAQSLTWDEVRLLARHELATIGAHTRSHFALAKLPADQVREEIRTDLERLSGEIGVTPRHFAYPYGDKGSAAKREFDIAKEFGFATAVTTRKGVLFAEHRHHAMGLPRVSLNGDYQDARFVKTYLSGAPFALWQGFQRLDVS